MAATIKLDIRKATAALSDMQKQIPFAVATAINDVAFSVMRAENEAMSSLFDDPRPFTQKSSQVVKATKSSLSAEVSLRQAQARYLDPFETGGEHATTGNNKDLLVPVAAKTDQYGQMTRGTIKRLASRADTFVGKGPNGVMGIWQRISPPRTGRKGKRKGIRQAQPALRLLVRFAPNTPVHKRLRYVERAETIVQSQGPEAIEKALQKALASAFR